MQQMYNFKYDLRKNIIKKQDIWRYLTKLSYLWIKNREIINPVLLTLKNLRLWEPRRTDHW